MLTYIVESWRPRSQHPLYVRPMPQTDIMDKKTQKKGEKKSKNPAEKIPRNCPVILKKIHKKARQ